MRYTKSLLLALVAMLLTPVLFAQTVLTGRVLDENKEALIGASVKVYKGKDLIRGSITDYDGKFRIALDPGTYELEVTYAGYTNQKVTGVVVLAGQINTCSDIILETGQVLSEVAIISYKVPLVKQDQTASGQYFTSEDIKRLPTRTTSAIRSEKRAAKQKNSWVKPSPVTANMQAPIPVKDEVRIRGNRSTTTEYYIDGVRVANEPGKKAPEAPKTSEPQSGGEQYNSITENDFQDARKNHISTFSIDVDGASYANLRRYLNSGSRPPRDAVRIEEMLNYFDYQYTKPSGAHPFEIHTELAPCPWNPENKLLLIGMQGQDIDQEQLPPSNLVFLVDVSGSMASPEKLPLVQQSLKMLVDYLRPTDRVSIVAYAGMSGEVLPSTPGSDKATIISAIERLSSGGSTAGAEGILKAYENARKNFLPRGNNRVILCTDGDFNVGVSSEEELVKLIEKERESGVYLSVLGYGTGNYQDGKMQSLANKGNGNHAYIDQLSEAKKVLVNEFGGTLFTIAKDVKLQLHFNEKHVAAYRLIGYENRLLAREDFNDDTKDAGELGAGHRVTALYEITPSGKPFPLPATLDSSLVSVEAPDTTVQLNAEDLMVVQLRYKKPRGHEASQLLEYHLNAAALRNTKMSENFALAAGIAEFGLVLRDSKYKGKASLANAKALVQQSLPMDLNGYRQELLRLIGIAETAR